MLENGELLFLNHASMLFRWGEAYYWTDPWVVSPAFGSWLQKPGMKAADFEIVDAIEKSKLNIIISHGHDDHCDDFMLTSRFSEATYVIPCYRSKGFLKRVERISASEVIEVDSEGQRIGDVLIRSYVNDEFTGNDAVVLFDTESFQVIHANDNWHSQPQQFFDLLQKNSSVIRHYFSQIGVADCFPRNYPQFTEQEYRSILKERIASFAEAVCENGRQLAVEHVYAYANQSAIVESSRSNITNSELIDQISSDFCDPNIVQLRPGNRINLLNSEQGEMAGASDLPAVFDAYLQALQDDAAQHVERYYAKLEQKASVDLKFISTESLAEVTSEVIDVDNSDKEVIVVLTAHPLIWSRILSAELNLEAIIIGGSGQIRRYPKSFNISLVHRALSEFSYIAQARLRMGAMSIGRGGDGG